MNTISGADTAKAAAIVMMPLLSSSQPISRLPIAPPNCNSAPEVSACESDMPSPDRTVGSQLVKNVCPSKLETKANHSITVINARPWVNKFFTGTPALYSSRSTN